MPIHTDDDLPRECGMNNLNCEWLISVSFLRVFIFMIKKYFSKSYLLRQVK